MGHEQALIDDGVTGHAADVKIICLFVGQSGLTCGVFQNLPGNE